MPSSRPRLLLLLPTTTYRTEAFVSAALRLDVDLTVAADHQSTFAYREPERLLQLEFGDPERAIERAKLFAARYPVSAVFGVDDRTALLAAMIAEALGLAHAPVAAVQAAGDKYRQRVLLREAGVPVPDFELVPIDSSTPRALPGIQRTAYSAQRFSFPCILKPLHLSASRGVIRADNKEEFARAHERLISILESRDVVEEVGRADSYLVESYIEGPEFALEGIVVDGRLRVLALFDKPDPMEGPFFAETIYVTPSRQPQSVRQELVCCAESAVRALGLERGPVHVELRYNDAGPWLIELAARPIGGKCGQALRFGDGGDVSLEELHLGFALGLRREIPELEPGAHGVLMIPVPGLGALAEVRGAEKARSLPNVTDVIVTAHRSQRLRPLPDESRYVGFVFAAAEAPLEVERALRRAWAELEVVMEGAD
ncbi:MAG: ATP-grasp domain-containing protein [Gemmatimonadales bacterium]